MATAYLRVSLLMGIPIPPTLVQTSKISLIRVRSLVQLTLTICMNLLLHTALISKISEMMKILLSIGSGFLTNLPKQKTNSIFGGYTPSPCEINNAGTGYQNPAPALLIVIISFFYQFISLILRINPSQSSIQFFVIQS